MSREQYLYDAAPEELQREQTREYTRREKLANWWYYSWKKMAFAAVLLLCAVLLARDVLRKPPAADYTVTVVAPQPFPQEQADALQQGLSAFAADRDGDGTPRVAVQVLLMDFEGVELYDSYSSAEKLAALARLNADLEQGTSCLFLLAQPKGFQLATEALLYVDGTQPAEGAEDWQRMVCRWQDCPALAALGLGEAMDGFYLAHRGPRTERQQPQFAGAEQLWQALTANAAPFTGAE